MVSIMDKLAYLIQKMLFYCIASFRKHSSNMDSDRRMIPPENGSVQKVYR